jgi:hypothetical protein
MISDTLRSHKRPQKTAMLTVKQYIDAAAVWRDLERHNFTVATLLLAGKSRREIAAAMRWDMTSVRSFLAPFRNDLHAAGIKKPTTP